MTLPAAVATALDAAVDPAFGKPMTQLGLVTGPRVEGDTLSLRYRLCAPSAELRSTVVSVLEKALAGAGISKVDVQFDLSIPTRQLGSDDPIPNVRNVLLVMSGKGGVGKSTTAANLACALAQAGARVGLLDADIYGPSVPTMFGVSGNPRPTEARKMGPHEKYGVKLMSIGFLLENPKQAIVWRGPMLHSALTQFFKDVDWGPLDYLVLDLPPGTGDVALSISQNARVTGAVVVTTPQEVALQDVYKAVSMCEKLQTPILGVVENMSFFVDTAGVRHDLFGKGGGAKVAENAKAPLLAQIPIDQRAREGGDAGTPVVVSAPESDIARAFIKLAEDLAVQVAVHLFERGGGQKAPAAEGPTRLRIVR